MEGRRLALTADQTALTPTILELAGLPIPEWVDGKSIAPSLLQGNDTEDNGVAFTQFFDPGNSAFRPVRWGTVGAIRGDRQYVIDIFTQKGALYRLSEANLQNNDISADESERAASMRELIASRFPDLVRSAT
jgi:arylsulfatase A-like enzyme